jgi:hypothetical protein
LTLVIVAASGALVRTLQQESGVQESSAAGADGGAFDELSVLKEVPARTMATGSRGVSYPDQIPSVVLTSWDRSGVRMAGGIVNLLC